MKAKKILVIGSSNTDMVIKSERLPVPGETILGGQFLMNPGGKGANQAVAAARLGGQVTFIAKVGNDIFGQEAVKGFQSHGIDTNYILVDKGNPSGVALIMVDDKGENCISVALGANAALQITDLENAKPVFAQSSHVLVQLEIPMVVVEYVAKLASQNGAKIVLNPAPAQMLSDDLLANISIITPNQTEAELLTGIKLEHESSVKQAAQVLRNKGVATVIITLGANGAYVLSDEVDQIVPSPKVVPVDTTAAGDTFNGALVVGLSEGMNLVDAVKFANSAAAYSVTKLGAQASTPLREDVN